MKLNKIIENLGGETTVRNRVFERLEEALGLETNYIKSFAIETRADDFEEQLEKELKEWKQEFQNTLKGENVEELKMYFDELSLFFEEEMKLREAKVEELKKLESDTFGEVKTNYFAIEKERRQLKEYGKLFSHYTPFINDLVKEKEL